MGIDHPTRRGTQRAGIVEEIKVGDSEKKRNRSSREALTSRKGKTDYEEKNNQRIQSRNGKPKGRSDNGRK